MNHRWLSWPLIRNLRAMQFRRLRPLRDGEANGTHVVRYYWAQFLEKHRTDVRGRALEIGTIDTLRKYGGAALTQAEAIDLTAHNKDVKVVADLSRAESVPSDTYDCFVNQFTTTVIYDIDAAVYHSVRILKPGGVLLINFWTCDFYFHRGLDMGTGAPLFMYWNFTPIQVENILRGLGLRESDFELTVYGNLLSRIAFLLNLPAEELSRQELDYADPGQPLLICARIVKPAQAELKKPRYRAQPWTPDVTPVKKGERAPQYRDVNK